MKILIVGDQELDYLYDHFDNERFKDIDIIVSTGDLHSEYLEYLVTMIHAPLLYVPGNHDKSFMEKSPGGCENIDGKIVSVKGIRFLGFGGCMLYNHGPYQYTDNEMKKRTTGFRLKRAIKKMNGFDILVTHAPAQGICDGADQCHTGFSAFNNLLDIYQPKYFFHGHQHLSYGTAKRINHYKNTTIINSDGYHLLTIE